MARTIGSHWEWLVEDSLVLLNIVTDCAGHFAHRSVVSQLRAGDDMTKVSLPAVFLSPFSALELGADRFLAFFDILNIGEQNKAKEAGLQRLVTVLRWYLASYAELEVCLVWDLRLDCLGG
jgi:hypothetical protein